MKLKLCVTELKLLTLSHFIEILMILTKYICDVSVWLTVGSVTLRFYVQVVWICHKTIAWYCSARFEVWDKVLTE